jgi:hypothetical protein
MARLIAIYVLADAAHIPTMIVPGKGRGSFVAEPVERVSPVSAEALLPVIRAALEAENPKAVAGGHGGAEAFLSSMGFSRWADLEKKAKYYTVLNTGKSWFVSPHLFKRGALVPDSQREIALPVGTSVEVVAEAASRLIAGS